MGMVRFVLDLPTAYPREQALDIAAAELDERGIRGWRTLDLRTTEPTGTALIRHFVFTYWAPSTVTTHPEGISYHDLWAGLAHPERAALLELAPATPVTERIELVLAHVFGSSLLVRGADGRYYLPRSFRIFLRAMSCER